MRKIYVLFAFLSIAWVNAQVGINEDQPKATLDVVGEPNVVETMDGIIAPRISGDELQNKTYTSQQKGAIVYVTQSVTNHASDKPQTFSVTNDGYYYFDGTKWIGMQKVLKLTKEQANELDYSTISKGDLVFVSQVAPEPANPVPQVASINSVGYYYYDNDQWNNQSIDTTLGESVYSASDEINDNLLSLTLDSNNEFTQIDLAALNAKFGDNNINTQGYYVAPSSGYYHVTYDLQLEGGVDISALGNTRIWLVKNPEASEPEIERKLIDAIKLSFDLVGPIDIDLVSIPVTSTTLSTLIRLEEGETLAFGTDPTTLELDILTSSRVTINIHKVAD